MNHLEHQHQIALISWARRVKLPPAPDVQDGATLYEYLFAIPNGGRRSPREGARLKAEGVKAGISDLMLPLRRGGYAGLWLEMKAPGEKPSKHQREWLEKMALAGYRAEWRDSWEKAAQLITDYLDATCIRANTIGGSAKKRTEGCSES